MCKECDDLEAEVHELEAACVGDIIRGATNLVKFHESVSVTTRRAPDDGTPAADWIDW